MAGVFVFVLMSVSVLLLLTAAFLYLIQIRSFSTHYEFGHWALWHRTLFCSLTPCFVHVLRDGLTARHLVKQGNNGHKCSCPFLR